MYRVLSCIVLLMSVATAINLKGGDPKSETKVEASSTLENILVHDSVVDQGIHNETVVKHEVPE